MCVLSVLQKADYIFAYVYTHMSNVCDHNAGFKKVYFFSLKFRVGVHLILPRKGLEKLF